MVSGPVEIVARDSGEANCDRDGPNIALEAGNNEVWAEDDHGDLGVSAGPLLSPFLEIQMALCHHSMAIGSPIAAADPIPCVLGDPLKSGDALTVAAPHREGERAAVRREDPTAGGGPRRQPARPDLSLGGADQGAPDPAPWRARHGSHQLSRPAGSRRAHSSCRAGRGGRGAVHDRAFEWDLSLAAPSSPFR